MPILPAFPSSRPRGRPRKTDLEKQVSVCRSIKHEYKVCDKQCDYVLFCMVVGDSQRSETAQEGPKEDAYRIGLVQKPHEGNTVYTQIYNHVCPSGFQEETENG
jgi:hypothetical protein